MPRTKFKEINGKECIGEIDYEIKKIGKGTYKKSKLFRLSLIYLEEKCRNKGYGRVIMEQIIEKAKKLGCKFIVVNLTKLDYDYYSSYEERRGFFEHFGFKFDEEGDFGKLNLR